MIDYLRQYSKAIVALLAPVLVTLGSRYGFAISDDQALTLATLITGFLVYLVPNKPLPSKVVTAEDYVTQVKDAAETQELK